MPAGLEEGGERLTDQAAGTADEDPQWRGGRLANSWGGPSAAFQLFIYIVSLVAGFFVGVVLAMRVNWLRALFTPKAQMAEDVLQMRWPTRLGSQSLL